MITLDQEVGMDINRINQPDQCWGDNQHNIIDLLMDYKNRCVYKLEGP